MAPSPCHRAPGNLALLLAQVDSRSGQVPLCAGRRFYARVAGPADHRRGIVPVIKIRSLRLRPAQCLIMPVIEAQRASILVPYDHRHINHDRAFAVGCRPLRSASSMPAPGGSVMHQLPRIADKAGLRAFSRAAPVTQCHTVDQHHPGALRPSAGWTGLLEATDRWPGFCRGSIQRHASCGSWRTICGQKRASDSTFSACRCERGQHAASGGTESVSSIGLKIGQEPVRTAPAQEAGSRATCGDRDPASRVCAPAAGRPASSRRPCSPPRLRRTIQVQEHNLYKGGPDGRTGDDDRCRDGPSHL